MAFLARMAFRATGTVVDPGDFAVRGGIIDIFPPGSEAPVRLDFFGDTLESIRSFDPESQRSTGNLEALHAQSRQRSAAATRSSIGRFRTGYAEAFGGIDMSDPLYESVTAGRRYQGMEHWLPLFHDQLSTLFDYLPIRSSPSTTRRMNPPPRATNRSPSSTMPASEGLEKKETFGAAPYKPLPPRNALSDEPAMGRDLDRSHRAGLLAFRKPGFASDFIWRQARPQLRRRAHARPAGNVYEAVKHARRRHAQSGRRVLIASWTEGSRERLRHDPEGS